MREWLSGGAPPCQGGGRGFDSRLALSILLSGGYAGFFVAAEVAMSPLECKFQCATHISQVLLVLVRIRQDIAVFRGCYVTMP